MFFVEKLRLYSDIFIEASVSQIFRLKSSDNFLDMGHDNMKFLLP